MSLVNLWATSAAFLAAAALAMRANMLKPDLKTWPQAPRLVQRTLAGLGIVMGMAAVSIFVGRDATAREALVYTALALGGLIMLANLNAQRTPDPPPFP